MKVAIDISPLKSGHQYRGIGAYTRNLIEALRLIKVSDLELSLVEKGNIPRDCDLVHYPYFDLFFTTLPLIRRKRTVVTIHDTIPLIFPAYYPPGIRGRLKLKIQKRALKTTQGVITDSENSKKDITRFLDYPKEKIYVVYLAANSIFKPISNTQELNLVRKKYCLPNRFILYVGDVNYNKNVPGLIKAFKKIDCPEVKLVLVGKAFKERELKETNQIIQLIKELGLVNKISFLGFVSGKDLAAIYNLAEVYCQPSFYEGFGLPVLEAMACGLPVVVSNKASLPEIVGKAAIFVNPYDIDDIAYRLRFIIQNENLRKKMAKKGLAQAKKFSWKKTANETYKIYQKILQS